MDRYRCIEKTSFSSTRTLEFYFSIGLGREADGEEKERRGGKSGDGEDEGKGEAWRGEEATITRENYRAVSPFGKLVTLSSGAVYAR